MTTSKLLFFMVLCSTFTLAQVGVNIPSGSTVDLSAAFEIQSGASPKGFLTPRMSTSLRTGITTPANGLLVFDTDLNAYYYNQGTSAAPVWVRINSGAAGRTNFRRIQSEADLIASSTLVGGNYQLYTNTFYEINGAINLTKPIDLNNAYVAGVDANEDILSFTGGTVFKGSTGGSIKNITLKGAKAFEITGPGFATATSLLVQNTMITDMTTSVGNISGLGLYFGSIVQFVNNADGITYSNVGNCLLDNQGWLSSNKKTFEKFTGSFGLIEKGSGFSTVDNDDVAFDVSDTSLAVGTGVLNGTVFSGTTSSTTGYVKENTTTAYPGYNFTNAWSVDSPGIPRENDDLASGNLYFNSASVTTISNTTPLKLPVNTDATRLFRTAEGAGLNSENRLIYRGESRRAINVIGSISFTATGGSRYTFSIYKNNIKVVGSDVIVDIPTTNDRQSVSIIGTVDVGKNDYLEIFLEKGPTNVSPNQFLITSYNLIFN